jgi:hypothetical protein
VQDLQDRLAQAREQSQEVAALDEQLASARDAALESLAAETERLTSELRAGHADQARVAEELAGLHTRWDEQERTLAEARASHANLREAHEKAQAHWEAERRALQAQWEQRQKEHVVEAEHLTEVHEKAQTHWETERQALQAQWEQQHQEHVDEAKRLTDAHENAQTHWEAERQALQEQWEQRHQEHIVEAGRLQALRERERAAWEEKAQRLRQECEALRQERDGLVSRRGEEMDAAARPHLTEAQRLAQEVEQLRQEEEARRQANEQLNTQIQTLRSELESLRARAARTRQIEKDLDATRAERERLAEQVEELRAQMAEASEAEDLERTRDDLDEDESEQLRARIDELEQALAEARAAQDDLAGRRGKWLTRLLCAPLELALSRRGLALLFLAIGGGLALLGWLRPPLSPDISGLHLPLGIVQAGAPSAVDLLRGPRRISVDSAGVLLLGMIGVGALIVLVRPRYLTIVAGALLVATVASVAATSCNHPALVELMDHEYDQWVHIVGILDVTEDDPLPLSHPTFARIDKGPRGDDQRADLPRGWVYVRYGKWILCWMVLGVLLATPGRISRRLTYLAGWGLVGVVMAGGFCFPRLMAEYYWSRAKDLEARCDPGAARRALDEAVAWFPELDSLQRTWLLAGKLDYQKGLFTERAKLFQAYQISRDKHQTREATSREDLPWLAHLTHNPLEQRQAAALTEELRASVGENTPAVRNQASRLYTDIGLSYFLQPGLPFDTGLIFLARDQQLGSALAAWDQVKESLLPPWDRTYVLAASQLRLDPTRPDRIEALLVPMRERLANQLLAADLLATLADAYFQAGQMEEARRRYAESADAFSMPKVVNHRAMKGLGGM